MTLWSSCISAYVFCTILYLSLQCDSKICRGWGVGGGGVGGVVCYRSAVLQQSTERWTSALRLTDSRLIPGKHNVWII